MDLTPTQIQALKTELTADPKTLGYAGMTDKQAADKLNQAGASNETVPHPVLLSYEFMRCVKLSEYDIVFTGWSAGQRDWFARLIDSGQVDASASQVKADIGTLFPAGSAPVTRAALLGLATRQCTRAEALFGAGAVVDYWYVGQARAS